MEFLTDYEKELIQKAGELDGYEYIALASESVDELVEKLGITDPMEAVRRVYFGDVKNLDDDNFIYTINGYANIVQVYYEDFKEDLKIFAKETQED